MAPETNPSSAPSSAEEEATAEAKGGTRGVVLLVEDDDGLRHVLARALEGERFVVRSARDGVDAVAHLQQAVPDVVLTDAEMPRMSGPALVACLREHASWRDIPVVAMTGAEVTFPSSVVVLEKPCPLENLYCVLDRMLARRG